VPYIERPQRPSDTRLPVWWRGLPGEVVRFALVTVGSVAFLAVTAGLWRAVATVAGLVLIGVVGALAKPVAHWRAGRREQS
jgi:hypothetical protein